MENIQSRISKIIHVQIINYSWNKSMNIKNEIMKEMSVSLKSKLILTFLFIVCVYLLHGTFILEVTDNSLAGLKTHTQ